MATLNLNGIGVVIGVPTWQQCINAQFVNSLYSTINYLTAQGVRHGFICFDGACVEKSRNAIVAKFMTSGYSHLLFIDPDQGWQPPDVVRLLAHQKDFVGAAIRKKSEDVRWNVNFTEGAEVSEEGLLLVDEIGTGFAMMSRRVFERTAIAMPEQRIIDKTVEGPFYRWYYPEVVNGDYLGEDINFARKWRQLCNGAIYVDVTLSLSHFGSYDYKGCLGEHLLEAQEASMSSGDAR